MEDLIDVPEVARRLHISKSYVFELARAHRMPAVRIGKRILFSPSALERWIQSISQEPEVFNSDKRRKRARF